MHAAGQAHSPSSAEPPADTPTDGPFGDRWGRLWPVLAVLLCLVLHVARTVPNLDTGFLAGHEFRQAQTALTIATIQRDADFSLAYPTPVFGPPWSIPMEFPLYQWAAAVLAENIRWSPTLSGRTIALAAFYLGLPAVLLVVRDLTRDRTAAWLATACVLTAPVHLFYSRAVLIESTAWAAALWFVWAFNRLCRSPGIAWLLLTVMTGTTAALVKVTTFMPWGMAALLLGLAAVVRRHRQHGRGAALRLLGWCAASALPPVLAATAWVRFSDTIKAASPATDWLTSSALRAFNFGTWADRTRLELWSDISGHFDRAIVPLPLMLLAVIAVARFGTREAGRWASGALLLFAGTAFTFPILYQFHDYYLYATAVLPLAGIGLGLAGLSRQRHGHWLGPLALAVVVGAQGYQHATYYAPQLAVRSEGGTPALQLLRDVTPPDAVIVVLGMDWSAAAPYHARRRAFMIHEKVAIAPAETEALLPLLDGEPVAALLVAGERMADRSLIALITSRLGLDPRPTVTSDREEIYFAPAQRPLALRFLSHHPNYGGLRVRGALVPEPNTDPALGGGIRREVSPNQAASLFFNVAPKPREYRAKFGLSLDASDDGLTLGCHPDVDLWIDVPAGAARLEMDYGIRRDAYEREGDQTDGVTFQVFGEYDDGTEVLLFERHLDPVNAEADRGTIATVVALPEMHPTRLRVSTRAGDHYTCDWAYWSRIEVH